MTDSLGVVRYAELPVTPWRNGRGATREIASRLLGVRGPDFVWRVSISEIEHEGPFSAYPGVDRVITLVDGVGLTVTVDGADHDLLPYHPFAFSGDVATIIRLPEGPTRALNVMTRRNRMSARVVVRDLEPGRPLSVAGATVLVALSGTARVYAADGAAAELAELDALVPRRRVRLVLGSGRVAVIRRENYRAARM